MIKFWIECPDENLEQDFKTWRYMILRIHPRLWKLVLNILKLTRISILILANLTLLLFKEQIYLNYWLLFQLSVADKILKKIFG